MDFIFLETVRDLYLTQHVKQLTRNRHGNIPSILDLVLTNEESMITEMDYLAGVGKSDPSVVSFTLFGSLHQSSLKTERYNYNNVNWNIVKSDNKTSLHNIPDDCDV